MNKKVGFNICKCVKIILIFILPALSLGEINYSINDSKIDKAIVIRNNFFVPLIPDTAELNISQWAENVKLEVKEKLENSDAGISTWGLFIRGILAFIERDATSEALLNRALESTETDPSTTWLLFVEFDRYNIQDMIEKALIQLEKQMFIEGGRTSSFISGQLLHYGFEYKKKGDKKRAEYYFTWSHRFCKDEITPLIQKSIIFFPSQLLNSVETIQEAWQAFTESFKAQLYFVFHLYSFIRKSVLFFVIAVFLIFSIKYIPVALHNTAHLYPINLSPNIGLVLLVLILLSILTFGFFPFLWIIAFILGRFVNKSERGVFIATLIFVVLSPVDNFIYDRLYNAIDPDGQIISLSAATEESKIIIDYKNYVLAEVEKEDGGFSAQLSTIFWDIKNRKFSQAAYKLKKLSDSYQSDVVLQNLFGIVYFLSGEIDSATTYFKKSSEKFTKDYISKFNLARCYIVSGNIAAGMEELKSAAEIKTNKVNSFIETNDKYFGNNWPNLRQIMFPECTPQYFWKKIFFNASAKKNTYNLTWGISFLGIPPIFSFILFIFFFVVLIVYTNGKSGQIQPKRVFECKYCGKILCRKCSSGMVCSDCAKQIISPRYSENVEKAKENIAKRTQLRRKTIVEFFNAFFPLSGVLLEKNVVTVPTIALLILSSLNCTFWFYIFHNLSFYWLNLKEIIFIMILPSLFTIFFLVKHLPSFISNLISLTRLAFTKER